MVMPLVAGFLVGYVLDREGRHMMVVCPKGETPPAGFTPLGGLITPSSGPLPSSVTDAWVLSPIDEYLADIPPYSNSTTYYCDKLLDARLASKVLLILRNTTDDAMTIRVVGHTQDSPSDSNGLVNIGGTQNLPAGSGLAFGINLSTDWYPFLGVTVLTDASAPSTGKVIVRAYGQRWRNLAAPNQQV